MKMHAVAAARPSRAAARAVRPPKVAAARSTHERQAEHLADRFMNGHSGLAHEVSATPAARFDASGSVALPMPTGLRIELEQAFGADLSRVRIHTDVTAQEAARGIRARAFTAGADIYFGTRAWTPNSPEGRHRIAHEVTHVLQQSGRVARDGRMRAEPRAASGGGVQRQPDAGNAAATRLGKYFESEALLQPSTDVQACVDAMARLGKASDDDALVVKYAARIGSAVGGQSLTSAPAAIDAVLADVPADELTDAVKAAFADAYKSINADAKANAVAGKFKPAQTAFGSWSFYVAHRQGDASWVTGVLRRHKVTAAYFPGALVAVAKLDFYGAGRGGLNLDMEMKFDEKMAAARQDATTYQPLMPEERVAVALAAFSLFDSVRLLPFKALKSAFEKQTSLTSRLQIKRNFIKQYLDPEFLPTLARNATGDPEVVQIAIEAGALIAPIAKRATDYWDRVTALADEFLVGKTAQTSARERAGSLGNAIRKRLPSIKGLGGVEKRLVGSLKQAAGLDRGGVPSPAEVVADFQRAAGSISQIVFQLDGAIAGRDTKLDFAGAVSSGDVGTTAAPDGGVPAVATLSDDMIYGLVMYLLFMLQSTLVGYKAPPRTRDDAQRRRDQDEAARRFKDIALQFNALGQLLGYPSLEDASFAIYTARQQGLTKSYVGLLAPFAQTPSGLDDFSKDFPRQQFSHGGLKGVSLAQMVFALYYQGLWTQLTDALAEKTAAGKTREFDYSAERKAIVNSAIEAQVAQGRLPRKYLVPKESTLLYVRPADSENVADLVPKDHPVMKALLTDQLGQNELAVTPGLESAHADGFVVWILPDMDELAFVLATLPKIADATFKSGKKLGGIGAYPTPLAWLLALNKLAADNPALAQRLADAAETELKTALRSLDAPLRRATNNERRKVGPLIEEQWELVPKTFLKGTSTYLSAPRRALQLTMIFAGNIQPVSSSEQQLQMTALLLELAPVLSRKLGESTAFGGLTTLAGTDRLDIVLPLYSDVTGAAKQASDPAFQSQGSTLALDFDIAELKPRTAQLQALSAQFEKTAHNVQSDVVLEGLPGENTIRVPDRGYPVTAPRNDKDKSTASFMVDGIVYTLVEVLKPFRYQPELLTRPSAVKWGDTALGTQRVWVDGVELDEKSPPVDLLKITKTSSSGVLTELTVTSKNVAELSELTYAVHMHIVLEQLSDLEWALEGFAEVLTTAMQVLFPEFSAEIAYAEILGSLLQFFAGPDFAMLKGALDGDAGGLFNKGFGALKNELTWDALWDWMLFDTPPKELGKVIDAVQLIGRMNMFQNAGHQKTQSAASKVFGRLLHVGAEVVHGVETMHEHVDFPVRDIALFVEGSPWLAILLRTVSNNLYRLEHMGLSELGLEKAEDLVGEVQQMYLHFEQVIAGLATFELPDEIVPLEAIIGMLANMLIDHLPIKYRIPLRESRKVDAVEKIFQFLFDKAAEQLKKWNIDPNILWRDYAKTAIQPYLRSAGEAVSKEVTDLLGRVPFLHDLATINVSDIAIRFATRDVPSEPNAPKASPKLGGPTVAAAPLASPRLSVDGGTGLDRSARRTAERNWGHDFAHVRLHRGDGVDRELRQSGALGATSGSHVFVDSRHVSDSTVMNHELAHVLQQSGPRPLGQRHAAQPMRGPGGGGWRIDTTAESEADKLAVEAQTPAESPRRVTRSDGLQPKLVDTIAKFFDKLGDPSKLEANAQKITKGAIDKKALKTVAPELMRNFADKLNAALTSFGKPGSVVSFAKPFDAADADLIDYIVNNRKGDVAEGMQHVLASGLREVEKKTGGNSADAGTEKFWILEPGRVETLLEEFFFGITGLSVDVEFNRIDSKGPDETTRKTIDPDKPFAKLKFNYIHLPMIGAAAELWKNIMAASFPKVKDPKTLGVYQGKARLALLGLQPGPGIYSSKVPAGDTRKRLVFGKRAQDLIEAYIHPPPLQNLPGDAAPTWNEYIQPGRQNRAKAAGVEYGQIGLRLGTFKENTNPDSQKGTDRASHHTVQYLLLEYFVNSKDRHKPFPHSLSLYPNVKGSGGRVETIAAKPGSADGITVGANEVGRGGTMPTILLSTHAHTLGNVHITTMPDDLTSESPSQGAAIHGVYADALGSYKDVVLGKKEPLQALAAKGAGKPFATKDLPLVSGAEVTPEALSAAIFEATNKTYTWMREHMNPKLERAVDMHEVEYYRAMVASATDSKIMTDGKPQPAYVASAASGKVMTEVRKRQAAVLESKDFGFEEKT